MMTEHEEDHDHDLYDEEEEETEDREDQHLLDLLALDDYKLSLVCSQRGEDEGDAHLHFSGEENNPDVFVTLHRWLDDYITVEVDISQLIRQVAHLNRLAGRTDEDLLDDAGIRLAIAPYIAADDAGGDGDGDEDDLEELHEPDEPDEEEEEETNVPRIGLADEDEVEAD